MQTLLLILRRLPRHLDRIGEALEHGSLTINVRLFSDQRDERVVLNLAGRAILGFVGAAIGIMSVLLLSVHAGPVLTSTSRPSRSFWCWAISACAPASRSSCASSGLCAIGTCSASDGRMAGCRRQRSRP